MARFLIVLALALTLVAAKQQHKFENTKQVLVELNKNALGNSILSLVQLATATGEGVDQINLLLQNVASTHNTQQTVADGVNENDLSTCEKLVNDFESAIAYHSTQIVAVTKLRDDSTEALSEAETEVRQATTDLEENEDSQTSEAATRSSQRTTFEVKDQEHADNVEAIDEASKIVQHLQAGVAFSQLKTRFEKVHSKLSNSKHALFKPLITALTQLAAKVDNKQIVKILDLLSQIRQQIVAARNALNVTEDRQAENYAVQAAHLTEENKRLTERKQFLEGAIISYKAVIISSNQSLEDHTLGLEDSTEALEIQNDWCDVQAEQYETGTVERDQQLDAIERIQDFLINKGGAVSDFLDERSSEAEDF